MVNRANSLLIKRVYNKIKESKEGITFTEIYTHINYHPTQVENKDMRIKNIKDAINLLIYLRLIVKRSTCVSNIKKYHIKN